MTNRIPRRTFLRGIGTAMALPLLDAMIPKASLAGTAAHAAPKRMAFLFVPNGEHMPDWTPTAEGANWELPWIMEPLRNVKKELTVLTGLTQHNAEALGDGGGDHARSAAVWLTGVHPLKTDGSNLHAGVSVDQIAAQHLGAATRYPSLEIGCEQGAQAGNCDSGYSCAYSSSVSWRGPATPVAKEISPRLLFDRLFSNDNASETSENQSLRQAGSKSILDFVLADAQQLRGRLGVHDQAKLDEYFTGVRELERRISMSAAPVPVTLKGEVIPAGIPQEYGAHNRLLSDILALAFQADLTRISTFMFANDGSNRSYRDIGFSDGHHDLSHHQGLAEKQMKLRQINRYHVTQLAYLLEKLASMKEGSGTVLDNCMIVYGAGISDGNRHNHDDLPILVAGKGGGTLNPGRHVTYPDGTPMANLFLSLLDRMGVRQDAVGDSTGRLQRLL